ncbi:MAG TPA: hypothetical protein DCG57_01260 [Candidatus Riflebacteria bacterium]|jgi:hypothetical protein|nr:hypothetical protein [Candidatus Riflebacteria bacterium]
MIYESAMRLLRCVRNDRRLDSRLKADKQPVLLTLALAFLLATGSTAWSQTSSGFPEYQVKAEMLFRIAEFVNWPSEAFSGPDQPFVIAIAGRDPFNSYLISRAVAERIHDRKVRVVPFEEDNHQSYHLVFIEKSEHKRLDELLSGVAGQPVLTVGDTDEFAKHGAHIGFQIIEGRMRFNVNLSSAEKSRLQIPAALLRLAKRVYGELNK